MEDKYKNSLNSLSRALLALHRSLLRFQKDLHESAHHKKLAPQELLHLTMTDPEFEWLKTLSSLIVQIDEVVDDKQGGDLAGTYSQAITELKALFIDREKNAEFKARILQALEKNSDLWMEIAELRKLLV